MRVHFHATLRQVVGGRVVEVDSTPGQTVTGLLDELTSRYPRLHSELFDADGRLHRHVHVMVNGRDAPFLEQGMQTVLRAEDALDIFPPVGGG